MFVSTFCIFFPGKVYCFWLQNMHVTLSLEGKESLGKKKHSIETKMSLEIRTFFVVPVQLVVN